MIIKDNVVFRWFNPLSFLRFLFLSVFFSNSLLAFSPQAKIQKFSEDGKKILLNRGAHDGVQKGDFGVLIKKLRDLDVKDLRMIPVAKIKNINLSEFQSEWILFHTFDSRFLNEGDDLLLFSESQILSGRRSLDFGKIKVVAEKNDLTKHVHRTLKNDKDMTSHFAHIYPEDQSLHEREYRSNRDVEVIDIYEWEKRENDFYPTSLYKSPHRKEFERGHRIATFEKLVTAYLKKVNDPDFSYEDFYPQYKLSFQTEWKKFLDKQSDLEHQKSQVLTKKLQKGEVWSEDYSDEELSSLLKSTSSIIEKERKHFIQQQSLKWSWYISYGRYLNNLEESVDESVGKNSYFTAMELEYLPFTQHRTLQRLSFQLLFSGQQNSVSLNNYNSLLNILSLGGGLNWYFLLPRDFSKVSLFTGLFFKRGVAQAQSETLEEQARFTTSTVFGARAGLKFPFKYNIGLRIAASMEKLNLDRFEQSQFNSGFPDSTSFLSWGSSFSLFYSF